MEKEQHCGEVLLKSLLWVSWNWAQGSLEGVGEPGAEGFPLKNWLQPRWSLARGNQVAKGQQSCGEGCPRNLLQPSRSQARGIIPQQNAEQDSPVWSRENKIPLVTTKKIRPKFKKMKKVTYSFLRGRLSRHICIRLLGGSWRFWLWREKCYCNR